MSQPERPSLAPRLIAILLVVVLGGCVVTFCDIGEMETSPGLLPAARGNPYYAALRLFEAAGVETLEIDNLDDLSHLPEASTTILMPTRRDNIGDERSHALLDWVSRGGHLIVLTWTLWDEEDRDPDPILDPLGVRQFMRADEDSDEDADEDAGDAPDADDTAEARAGSEAAEASDPNQPEFDFGGLFASDGIECDRNGVVSERDFPDRETPLQVRFISDFWIESSRSSDWTLGDRFGDHLVSYRFGDGRVTALTDDCFLRNPFIQDLDHAELLWRLARADARVGAVWLVIDEAYPGAWLLTRRYAWPALVAAAICIGIWLWWRAPRFGPRVVEAPPVRRSLMEHVEAAGRFHWKHGHGESLRDGVRSAVMAELRSRRSAWAQLEPARLHAQLAEVTGLPEERIREALAEPGVASLDHFANHIATLEAIRKAL